MHGRIGHGIMPDQLVLGVRVHMVLVAEEAAAMLLRPARIASRSVHSVAWGVGLSHERSDHRPNAIAPPSPTFTAWHLDGKAMDDWDGSSTWIELMTDFPNRIIHILRGCPNGLTSKDIAERLGATRRNLSSRLSKLAAYGIIDRVRGTVAEHGTKGAIYRAPCNAAQDGRI